MSTALRPVLRPSTLPSLPLSSGPSTTYICQACRHARLLRRPKRPYTFTQLVTLSDGSAFTMRTTSPMPVYRSTRDTRNAPLWNPSSKELLNVEDDEAGRLAGFRARFGKGFDAQRESTEGEDLQETQSQTRTKSQTQDTEQDTAMAAGTVPGSQGPFFQKVTETKHDRTGSESEMDDYEYEFEEDDANLLDLISSYGQEPSGPSNPAKEPKKGGKK